MPGGKRIRAAVSSDVITWSRLSAPILVQARTLTLVIYSQGLPLLDTAAHKVNPNQDGFVVSAGTVGGRTWRHCSVILKGFLFGP
jgi:hypothetical protein